MFEQESDPKLWRNEQQRQLGSQVCCFPQFPEYVPYFCLRRGYPLSRRSLNVAQYTLKDTHCSKNQTASECVQSDWISMNLKCIRAVHLWSHDSRRWYSIFTCCLTVYPPHSLSLHSVPLDACVNDDHLKPALSFVYGSKHFLIWSLM